MTVANTLHSPRSGALHPAPRAALHPAPRAALHSAATPPHFICGAAAHFICRAAALFIYRAAALFIALAAASARAETVTIANAADWAAFAERVNAGETALDATMTANVRLRNSSPTVGTDAYPWKGTFDGGNHTLTVDWDVSVQYFAPFRHTAGCTISNLCVAGTIKTSNSRAAGFLGLPRPGRTTLRRCRSSVTIDCSFAGNASCGGFVAYTHWSTFTLVLEDCLFDGSLLGPDATHCGGFFGFNSADPSVRIENCLFDPKETTMSTTGAETFGVSYSSAKLSLANARYTRRFGNATDGAIDSSSASPGDLASLLGSSWTNVNGKVTLVNFARDDSGARDQNPGMDSFVYQGVLRDAQGHALAELSHNVAFRLYAQAAGGVALWGRSAGVLLDGDGLFNARLGDGSGEAIEGVVSNGLASVLAENAGSALYVGLSVDGSPEIMPRQKILAVPYAVRAANAAHASGDFGVAGATEAETLSVSGDVSARSAAVAGAATAGTLAVAGDADIPGNLSVGGAVTGAGTIPVGGIVVWSGSVTEIPDGWALCDGQTAEGRKTPNLKGRFVAGHDPRDRDYAVDATGGEKRHKLTQSEMPSHSHSYNFKAADLNLSWQNHSYFFDRSEHYPDNGRTKYTNNTGGGKDHENRPPYYALCYIMRVR